MIDKRTAFRYIAFKRFGLKLTELDLSTPKVKKIFEKFEHATQKVA